MLLKHWKTVIASLIAYLPVVGCSHGGNLVEVKVTTTHCNGVQLEVPICHELEGSMTNVGGRWTMSLEPRDQRKVCRRAGFGWGAYRRL